VSGVVVGVDVGGTFTDLVVMAADGSEVKIAKVPTTLDNQAFGVLAALDEVGTRLAEVDNISHGTTTTTNALLERKFSVCGLITTKGFRDVLELGRRTRPQPYGLIGQFVPLIPRERRLEVAERMDADGNVLTPLDETAVADAARALLAAGCESLVIHFLHSYRNPAHEIRAREIAQTLEQINSERRAVQQSMTDDAEQALTRVVLDMAEQAKRDEVMKFITLANYGLHIGNFEFDLDDGEVRFKTSIDVEGVEISDGLCRNLMELNFMMMGRYFDGLRAVMSGSITAAGGIGKISAGTTLGAIWSAGDALGQITAGVGSLSITAWEIGRAHV